MEDIVCSKTKRFCHWSHQDRFILLNMFHWIASPHTYSFHFNILRVLALLITRGVFQVLLLSAHPPYMTGILIFPIFMDTPEYNTRNKPEDLLLKTGCYGHYADLSCN